MSVRQARAKKPSTKEKKEEKGEEKRAAPKAKKGKTRGGPPPTFLYGGIRKIAKDIRGKGPRVKGGPHRFAISTTAVVTLNQFMRDLFNELCRIACDQLPREVRKGPTVLNENFATAAKLVLGHGSSAGEQYEPATDQSNEGFRSGFQKAWLAGPHKRKGKSAKAA